MYDFAVNTLGYSLQEFHNMFLVCGMEHQFEVANPTYVAGKNGCEVAKEVIMQSSKKVCEQEDIMYLDKSSEYWVGWVLAYYQWISSISYQEINKCVPIIEIYAMYDTLHEADVNKFVEIMDEKCLARMNQSRLRRLRTYAKLSQRQLSDISGVPLRQIQLFEQGQRDINKTQAMTIMQLAHALQCDSDALLEHK